MRAEKVKELESMTFTELLEVERMCCRERIRNVEETYTDKERHHVANKKIKEIDDAKLADRDWET